MTSDEAEAAAEAQRRRERADDPSAWWAPVAGGGVMTHLLRRDGSWTIYRWEKETGAKALERGGRL